MDFTLLTNAGVDVKSGLERFVGNEELYARMLKRFLEEPSYGRLVKAVQEQDKSEALAASHTLKGLCGNLSFMRLFELFSNQVALMRADEWEKAVGMMSDINESYDAMTEAIKEWLGTL